MRRVMQTMLSLTFLGLCLALVGPLTVQPTVAQQAPLPAVYDPAVCAEFVDGSALSAECEAMIAAFPRPTFEHVPQDVYTLSQFSFWRVGPAAINTYDAPNGSVNGEIPQGFNFVNAIDLSVDNWLQIQGGSWVRREDARWTEPSYLTGVLLRGELQHPFAWVLDLSRIPVSRYPGGPRDNSTGRWLERYEMVNIFAQAVDQDGWRWYMIGPNQWVEQRFVAKALPVERPEGVSGRWVSVDLYEQVLVAWEDDTPVFATLISSGLKGHETNEGLFSIWSSVTYDPMSGATGAPSAYALQYVPWVMYFDGGISLHGTYWHDLFGYRQSHGCVNLTISDAKWLYHWASGGNVGRDTAIDTPVYVWSSGTFGVTATGL